MQRLSLFLSVAVASAFAHHAAAQDDCINAVQVFNGANGPFTNVGSTTSAPAWPCAAGGNDVWYFYVAPLTATVEFNLCGSSYDTALEVFDGTGGCGGLVSIGCNDDSCGLQSRLSLPLNAGTTYYIRVGGFASLTGTFTINIGTAATITSQGTGCGLLQFTSFYENFTSAGVFDLSGQSFQLINTGGAYIVVPGGSFNAVGSLSTAMSLPLTDDSQTTAGSLGLSVGSNGWIALGPNNTSTWFVDVPTFLNNPDAAFACWHDFNPTIAGSGTVKYEEAGSLAQITWDGVWDYGGTSSANASTFQFQYDASTGNVTIAFGTMSLLGGSTNTGFLVGYSPGGSSLDPGSTDLSTISAIQTSATDLGPLSLSANGLPVQTMSSGAFTVTTGYVPPSALIHIGIVGLTRPGLPLGLLLGATGCDLNASLDVLVGPDFFPTANFTWTAMNLPALPMNFAGFEFNAQAAVLGTTANSALGLGLLTSNGLKCTVGDL